MKRFSPGKAVAGAAVAALLGVASQAQAHTVERIEGEWVWIRYTFKGAQGHLFKVRRQDAGRYVSRAQLNGTSSERREAVAGFRVETNAQGRKWVLKPRTLKGIVVPGFIRVPLKDAK